MMQATSYGAASGARDAVTDAASTPAGAALIGALFDLVFTLRREPIGPTATMPLLVRLAADGPMRSCDLALALHLDQSTVSRHVAALESDGLVHRAPQAGDRRAHLVELTPAGTQAAHDAIGERVRRFESAVAHWPEDDIAGFARHLTTFVNGLAAHERTTA